MSRAGNPFDNAHIESFLKTLKHEEVYLRGYRTTADLCAALPTYLEEVYNGTRLHSALGYLPPAEYEEQHHLTRTAQVKSLALGSPVRGGTPRTPKYPVGSTLDQKVPGSTPGGAIDSPPTRYSVGGLSCFRLRRPKGTLQERRRGNSVTARRCSVSAGAPLLRSVNVAGLSGGAV